MLFTDRKDSCGFFQSNKGNVVTGLDVVVVVIHMRCEGVDFNPLFIVIFANFVFTQNNLTKDNIEMYVVARKNA